MPLLKTAAWLACGVVLAHMAFSVAAVLSLSGTLPGKFAPVALISLLAVLIGALLCHRAQRLHTYLMGAVIAGYMPAIRAALWGIALIQDLFRRQGIPGESMNTVAALAPNGMLMIAMTIIGVIVVLSGRLAARAAAPAVQRIS